MQRPVCLFMFVACVCLAGTAAAEPGVFVEPDVVVLSQIDGDAGAGVFGWAVAEVADLDGDGAREALTSAPYNSLGGANAGKIYVYSGATGAPLFEATGEAGDNLGYGIADAGDVDGDGATDILAGAPGVGPGRALVYSGIDGAVLRTFAGESDGGQFGAAVAGVGDIDGDGHADVVVGAPLESMEAGRIHAFSGTDGALLWTRDGAPGSNLGGGAGSLGDVDGDGVPDVVAGAPAMGGAVYVLSGIDGADVHPPLVADPGAGNLGHFFVAGLGDLDQDGVPEIYGGDYADGSVAPFNGKAYVWSGQTGERMYTFTGEGAGHGCGCGRRAGDVDGDGVPDIAVGCYAAAVDGVTQAGYVSVFAGSDGALVRAIHGTTAMEQLGFDVVSPGDVDGDGRDDLLVSGANANRIYILGGAPKETGTTSGDPTDTGAATTTDTTADPGDTTSSTSSTSEGPTTAPDGSGDAGPDASAGGGGDDPGGCACVVGARNPPVALLGFLVLLARRRR